MSTAATIALVVVAVWLAVLTVVVMASVRQLALVTQWVKERGASQDDGLDVGAALSEETQLAIPELREGLCYVVFLGGDCQPCREFAVEASRDEELSKRQDDLQVVTVVTGSPRQVEGMSRLLPRWFRVIQGEEATRLTDEFLVQTTPSVYETERGTVTGRAVAGYGVVNFLNLIQARATSDAAEFAGAGSAGILEVHAVNANSEGK
jgi:hypothetical protein